MLKFEVTWKLMRNSKCMVVFGREVKKTFKYYSKSYLEHYSLNDQVNLASVFDQEGYQITPNKNVDHDNLLKFTSQEQDDYLSAPTYPPMNTGPINQMLIGIDIAASQSNSQTGSDSTIEEYRFPPK